MNPVVKSVRLAPDTDSQGEPGKFKISSPTEYKKVLTPKHYFCSCWSCNLVGNELIIQQYSSNVLIEDRSTRIFDPFLEKVPGY